MATSRVTTDSWSPEVPKSAWYCGEWVGCLSLSKVNMGLIMIDLRYKKCTYIMY